MTKLLLRGMALTGLVLVLAGVLSGCPLAPVNIPDPNLELALRKELNNPLGVLTKGDLGKILELSAPGLSAPGASIVDLTGIENCTNLETLDLSGNAIVSIAPLSGLAGLQYLDLGGNQITNIQPLSGLYALTTVKLWGTGNAVLDYSPLVLNADGGGLIEGKVYLPAEKVLNSDESYKAYVAADVAALKSAGVTVIAITEADASPSK